METRECYLEGDVRNVGLRGREGRMKSVIQGGKEYVAWSRESKEGQS